MHGEKLWIYCDIDGTLTTEPGVPDGPPREDVIGAVKGAVQAGKNVVLWSASGGEYAKAFAVKHGIQGLRACLAKPDVIVDDKPEIRPPDYMIRMSPEEFAA